MEDMRNIFIRQDLHGYSVDMWQVFLLHIFLSDNLGVSPQKQDEVTPFESI